MNLSENADNIFITSNYCAFLAINGEIDLAYERLLQTRQQARNTSEAFYEICIENNILILEILKKTMNRLKKYLTNCVWQQMVSSMNHIIRKNMTYCRQQ